MMGTSIVCIKQDINFLDKPLWFQNLRHDGMGFVWGDIEGFEYRTGYKPPDKVDMLILLYLMYKSQKADYQTNIVVSKYEILKACDFPTQDTRYYKRIEDCLKRWKNVSIEFQGTFYDGKKYLTKLFGILDEGEIRASDKKVEVKFNENWLLKIKESRYFRSINFERYKALKRPLSRRLFEFLEKSFLGRDTFAIHLTKLGVKLTLIGVEVKTKHETKRVIYASHVLQEIKPAINEINKLSRDPDICKKMGLKPEEIFTITYEITGVGQDRIIIFQRHPVSMPLEKSQDKTITSELQSLFALLKKRTEKLDKVVGEYFQSKGFEYVKWNILYANAKAKKSYSTYLQQALENNWAEEWAQEERERIEAQVKREEEERKQKEEAKRKELERLEGEKEGPRFMERIETIDLKIKAEMWEKAEAQIPQNITVRRENLVKIAYMNLLWEYLNEQGESFSKGVLDNFRLAFRLEKPVP
jgi:hypothetical protein